MTAPPLVAALEMGYGHVRAAQALADAAGTEVVHVDRPPVAGADEQASWARARTVYEGLSRGARVPLVGSLLARAIDAVTAIDHLHPYRDLSRPDRAARALARLVDGGLGAGLAAELERSGRPLLATYFTPALAADRAGIANVHCVVTDADLARAWVAPEPARSGVVYLAPSRRAVRRLIAYGVPREHVRFTGFPLPPELLGGRDLETLRANLAARLVRLDADGLFREPRARELEAALGPLPEAEQGRPPLLVFAVGGAGAQGEIAVAALPGLRPLIEAGRLRLALVAGVRESVAEQFEEGLARHGLDRLGEQSPLVLHDPDFLAYYRRFNDLLAGADVLWTKPSEMTFYGALGLPLVLGPPLGVHERYNRRWARERGAALKQREARFASQWIIEWLEEGLLASAAWAGFQQLPSAGTWRILDEVERSVASDRRPDVDDGAD